MNTTDKKIAEVLAKFGEPMAGNVWRVQGTAVIYHKTLERIAAQAGITWDIPTIVRAEREEAAILVAGRMGERMEWSIGEATIGMNYRVSGKQAAYPWAMAEKRAKDRVILKLIELSGFVYSEEEADEFKQSAPLSQGSSASSQASPVELETQEENTEESDPEETSEQRIVREIRERIKKTKTAQGVTDFMLLKDTQRSLNDMPDDVREGIRDFAAKRLVELGWKPKTRAA